MFLVLFQVIFLLALSTFAVFTRDKAFIVRKCAEMREKFLYSELLWSVFSHIWTEYWPE